MDCKPKVWQLRLRWHRRLWHPRTHDAYVLTMRRQRLKERVRLYDEGAPMQRIYTQVFATIKNYLLLLYHVRVVKPFRISHIILRPLSWENLTLLHVNSKGTDQSAHPASLIGAFVICSLESIIAKQLNLVHSKLQASIEQAGFSKVWVEILKKRDTAHIEPTHYPNQTVTIQANRRHFRATCT